MLPEPDPRELRAPRRGQRGASLILVLALVTFLGLLVPATLGLVSVGSRATVPVKEDRRETYAATSAIEAAIATVQSDLGRARAGGPCPDLDIEIDGLAATVECAVPAAPCWNLHRSVSLLAKVGDPTDPDATVGAQLRLPFAPFIRQPVEVVSFVVGATSVPPVLPIDNCDQPPEEPPPEEPEPEEPPPPAVVVAAWEGAGSAEGQGGNRWRAEAPLRVSSATDPNDFVEGVTVTIVVDYRITGTTEFVPDPTPITGTTSESGVIPFHSRTYGINSGNEQQGIPGPVDAARMRVVEVEADGAEWQPGPDLPQIVVER